jgi:hypothetical protein
VLNLGQAGIPRDEIYQTSNASYGILSRRRDEKLLILI